MQKQPAHPSLHPTAQPTAYPLLPQMLPRMDSSSPPHLASPRLIFLPLSCYLRPLEPPPLVLQMLLAMDSSSPELAELLKLVCKTFW